MCARVSVHACACVWCSSQRCGDAVTWSRNCPNSHEMRLRVASLTLTRAIGTSASLCTSLVHEPRAAGLATSLKLPTESPLWRSGSIPGTRDETKDAGGGGGEGDPGLGQGLHPLRGTRGRMRGVRADSTFGPEGQAHKVGWGSGFPVLDNLTRRQGKRPNPGSPV